MLGVRLSADEEERLARYARETGRPKSAVARTWILQALDREAMDQKIARAASLHAKADHDAVRQAWTEATDAWLRALDAEDGGYDWGPEGPPGTT